MSLPSPTTLANAILALPKTPNKTAGVTATVGVIASYMNQVQGGPTGTIGIFTLDQNAMIAILLTQNPVTDTSWISNFANAWYAGCSSNTITPGTVTNPAWSISGVDTLTAPSGSTTITNLTSAKAILASSLASATATNNPPQPFAQAIHDATISFIFNCIGIGPGPSPLPIPISAQ